MFTRMLILTVLLITCSIARAGVLVDMSSHLALSGGEVMVDSATLDHDHVPIWTTSDSFSLELISKADSGYQHLAALSKLVAWSSCVQRGTNWECSVEVFLFKSVILRPV